jgi:hypothetical protein
MSETRKLAAILVSDVVVYSRLAGADEERTLARLRGLPSDLIKLLASGIADLVLAAIIISGWGRGPSTGRLACSPA